MYLSVGQRSRLIRVGVWLLLLFAALSSAALIYDWMHFMQSMPDRGWNIRVIRLIGLFSVNLLFAGLLTIVALLFVWGRTASSLPDLQGWHVQRPESEFRASDAKDNYTLTDYLDQEARVFSELEEMISGDWAQQSTGEFCRFCSQSASNPNAWHDRNWNQTVVLETANPIGGALLLHGLSDSPYSLRALGQRLHAEGYTVIFLRLPGHGTNPRALADVTWNDWRAAVNVAAKGLRKLIPADAPIVLAGYSNGGALSVNYAMTAINDSSLPMPAAIALFSPMIGVSPLARITQLYHTVATVFRNRKAQWQHINAEIDPFKYSSWPMNANVQAWAMTQAVERKLARTQAAGKMERMPPILTMQSVVDSTVNVPKLITALFDRLPGAKNELFLFDVNRLDRLSNLVNLSFEKSVVPKLNRSDRPYRLCVLTNENSESGQLMLRTRDGASYRDEPLSLSWPDGVVSLSHVAVPIAPDDPVYGAAGNNQNNLSLGTLSMRAEPGALMISNSLFVRCRNNPFYQLMEDRVVSWVSVVTQNADQQNSDK